MEQLKLNMIPNGVNPVFHASQYDKGRQIGFVLDETLSSAEVTVSYRAKDGTEHGNVQTSVSGNTITDTIPEEVLTDYGIIEGEVDIDGIGSLNFFVEVEKDAYDGGVITTQTASGAIATFETNIETAFVSLKSDINPVQDLHGYTKPWSGGGGKNKLENTSTVTSLNSVTFTKNEDGSVKLTGTASAAINSTYINFFLLPSGTYIFTDGTTSTNCYFYLLIEGSGTWYKNGDTFTVDGNTRTRVVAYVANGSATNLTLYPMIRLASVSDATFEPYSNICPISGFSALNVTRTGKNFLNIDNFVQRSGYTNLSASISGSDISISGYTSGGRFACFYAFTEIGKTYTVKFTNSTGIVDCRVQFSDTEPTEWISGGTSFFVNKTLTFTSTKAWCMLWFELNANATITELQLEQSNQATAYKPYNGQTATVNFGQTVYGGVADVTNGKVTITHKIINLWDFNFTYNSGDATPHFTSNNAISDSKNPSSYGTIANILCSQYDNSKSWGSAFGSAGNNGYIALTPSGLFGISDDRYTSPSDFKTALQTENAKLVYELATPIEITTTPENLTAIVGQNNVYADTNGDTEVEYYIEV